MLLELTKEELRFLIEIVERAKSDEYIFTKDSDGNIEPVDETYNTQSDRLTAHFLREKLAKLEREILYPETK